MEKNIKIWPIEIDNEWVWFSDALIGGLYRCHRFNGEVKCEITPIELHKKNIFRLSGIVSWNDYVILCPFFINCPIVVFSKETKCIKWVYVCGVGKYTSLDGARIIENKLYLNMYHSNIAVLIFCLDKLCNPQIKEITPIMLHYPDNCIHTVWFAKSYEDILYLPDQDKKIIYKVEKGEISSIIAEIPQTIFTIYCYQSELWIISIDGWEIYRVNQQGKLKETILLKQNGFLLEEQGVFHIIVFKEYIFLIFRKETLGCYDRKKQCKVNLKIPSKKLKNQYTDILPGTFLFGIKNNNKIFFPPYGNCGLEIDLQTFEYQFINVFFPKGMKEDEIEYCDEISFAHRLMYKEECLFNEVRYKSLSIYLKYIISNNLLDGLDENLMMSVGKKVYYKIIK